MTPPDYIVIVLSLAAMIAVGVLFSGRVKNSADLFSAGQQSPWWVSGLSAFMTLFSAGTFVVWGGIAFRMGAVAVSILLCLGFGGLLAGTFLAGKWHAMGITSPGQFVRLRYGKPALYFYTCVLMLYRLVGSAVALYALAVVVTALAPLPEGHFLRDSQTGNFNQMWAIAIFTCVVVIYTVIGGLWAVLMTDVLQFVILTVAVLFVIPLLWTHVGGWGQMVAAWPVGFLSPTAGEFTWVFLGAWVVLHFFMIGADWAFIQRYLCVRSQKDARWAAWLLGALFLISPAFWMLPPMIYRAVDASANPEQAYILACKLVLPPGMLGLMVAAMFSATASMVSSQINLFAGVLAQDIAGSWRRGPVDDARSVRDGRFATLLLGAVLLGLALLVPFLGGAENVVLSINSLLIGPLLIPMVWGVFRPAVGNHALWLSILSSFALACLVKFGLIAGTFDGVAGLGALGEWLRPAFRTSDVLVGLIAPTVILLVAETRSRGVDPGWIRLQSLPPPSVSPAGNVAVDLTPLRVVGWMLGASAVVILLLLPWGGGQKYEMAAFGIVLLILASVTEVPRWRAVRSGG